MKFFYNLKARLVFVFALCSAFQVTKLDDANCLNLPVHDTKEAYCYT